MLQEKHTPRSHLPFSLCLSSTTRAFLLLNTASVFPPKGLCVCYSLHLESFLLITSFKYLLKCYLIRVVSPVPPAPYNVMSSSSFSLHRNFRISKKNANIFLTCYCPLVCSCIGEWQAWHYTPSTQARAQYNPYLVLLHTQYPLLKFSIYYSP